MLEERTQFAAKIESVEGTAETLAAADAVLHANGKFSSDTKMNPRPMRSSSLSPFAAVPGSRFGDIEIDVELKGSGTPGTPPEFGKLLKGCGMQETIVAGTSVTYTTASASVPTLTASFYEDGSINKIWGSRGDVKLIANTGEPVMLHFAFKGADFSVTDGSLLAGVSYQETVPPAFLNAQMTIDSYAALVGKIEVGMGNKVVLRPDSNASSGYKTALISQRLPIMSMDPEKVLVATYDFYGKLRSGNEAAFTAQVGATAGNICTITEPKVQYTKIDEAARDGVRNLGIDCQLNRNSGDDEISLVFT